jgi:hypothetical protein
VCSYGAALTSHSCAVAPAPATEDKLNLSNKDYGVQVAGYFSVCNEMFVRVSIIFDSYPQETSWTFVFPAVLTCSLLTKQILMAK